MVTAGDQTKFQEIARCTLCMRTHDAWWLGIEKDTDGNWKTFGGADIVDTNWADGQPNNDGNCVYALGSGSSLGLDNDYIYDWDTDNTFKWFDTACSSGTAKNGVCQFQT